MNHPTRAQQTFLAMMALLGWFALILQFYLILKNRVVSVPETILRYFSFFTLLTNILVATFSTIVLLKPLSRWGKYFSGPDAGTAIAVYISMVGIVYNVILRNLWNPKGLERVADELLHLVIPVLFVAYWAILAPKAGLKIKKIFAWLLYPLLYFLWVLIFGKLSGFYPYFFINVTELGYSTVFFHVVVISFGFLLLSFIFVMVGRLISLKRND
ncbi:MAG: Pr6Pr family membrane protein [Ginsengibacter sp.]